MLRFKSTTAVPPHRWLRLLVAGLLLPSLACTLLGTPKTFRVNTSADDPDASVGDGVCATSEGKCSLRAAVAEAQEWEGAVTIHLPEGVYRPRESNGLLLEKGRITLRGAGAENTFVDGGESHRLFKISGGLITFEDLTIRNGRASSDKYYESGGGLLIDGENVVVTLRDVVLRDNKSSIRGAGLAVYGRSSGITAVMIQDSHIADNTITGSTAGVSGGAGIYIDAADLTLLRSTLDTNVGGNSGGGLRADTDTRLRIIDSTLAGNRALYGGGLLTQGRLFLHRSTLSGNAARLEGGGLYLTKLANVSVRNSTLVENETNIRTSIPSYSGSAKPSGTGGIYLISGGTLVLSNSIVAANTRTDSYSGPPVADDCRGTLTSEGHNLLGSSSSCTFTSVIGDRVGSSGSPLNPKLGSLANNGGPTKTHLPASGSPAIDNGSAGTPDSAPQHCFSSDQRGESVPQDGDGNGSARCDIGAVEVGP